MVLPPPVSINIRLVLMPFSQEPVSTQRAGCRDACASRGAVHAEGQGSVPGGRLLQHARRESAFSTARRTSRGGSASPRLSLPPRELPLPAARVCPTPRRVRILACPVLMLQGRDSEVGHGATWQVSLQAFQEGFAQGQGERIKP